MNKHAFLILTLFCVSFVSAQNKMLQWTQLMDYRLYPQRQMRAYAFVPGSDKLMYVKSDTLVCLLAQSKETVIFSLSDVNAMLSANQQDNPTQISYIQSFTPLNENQISIRSMGKEITVDLKKHTATSALAAPDRVEQRDGNLYVDNHLIAEGDGYNIVLGESVHRNEFGISGGLFWSPNSRFLAFYRMDQSMVTDYPLVNTKKRIADTKPFKYPMAGMKSHEVTIGVYDSQKKEVIYLQSRNDTSLHEREMYLTSVCWSPDERYLFVAKVNREQNHMWLERYDARTGLRDKVLFEEQDNRYVEPCEPIYFTPKGDQFLWFSMRDGFKHLYLYSADGTLLKQLTSGNFEVEEFIGFDKNGENIFVYANKDNLMGRQAFQVNIKSGRMELLTPAKGTHSVVINKEGTALVDVFSSVDNPLEARFIQFRSDKTGKISSMKSRLLFHASNPLADYAMPNVSLGSIKAADGTTDLFYRLITPPNMKNGEKYPTLVYVYGGPHSQLVTDSWLGGGNLYFLFLAQQGYVVFTVDNRGTDNRGFEFESCTHRHLGEIELADQMEGVKFLQSLPYVDTSRMGVEGWSFGGFMTITMKLAHPEVFKVGCAGGPVIDWKWYEIMYGERYMDTPDENPDGYANSSLLDKANQLDGHLLVIHGAEDNTVVWQHSLEFIERCINNLKQVDYFVYPHHEHNVRGRERLHLYKKMFDYYETYLK